MGPAPRTLSFGHKKPKLQKPKPEKAKVLKRKRENEDIDTLQSRVDEFDLSTSSLETFADLPLSRLTLSGLEASHFKTCTDIQKKAIATALKGKDVLGAAKTGSGKTLAFIVPVLELLYRRRWTEYDGCGALILSPTRELAIQINQVLREIGRYFDLSAGLLIGGKSLKEEQEGIGRMNILICTPSRILSHLDSTSTFRIDNLQILVLDEADRLLDIGFQETLDAICQHLPKQRQTLLFSATQTRKVNDLARLSLHDPEYVAVHESENATPSTLRQNYVSVLLPDKIDTLFGFLRANVKSKIIVFMSTRKQVRFIYETIRQLQPGVPLLQLLGKQKQRTRLDVTRRFSSSQAACLFCTDVAARGLDFPSVDWVIQLDCPEDPETYIHRVGRTARIGREGRAVLFLCPEEEKMLERLEQKNVPIEEIKVRQKKQTSIKSQLQNMCFQDVELKYLGQKAFITYVKSVHVQKDKEVFQLNKLPLAEYARSLGLPGTPQIKFMKGDDAKKIKNQNRQALESSTDDTDADEGSDVVKKGKVRDKYDRMFERRNQDVLAEHRGDLIKHDKAEDVQNGGDSDSNDGFMTVKRRLIDFAPESEGDTDNPKRKSVAMPGKEPYSKRREKMANSKKALLKTMGAGASRKLIFDEDGNPKEAYTLEGEEEFQKRGTASDQRRNFILSEAKKIEISDMTDKQRVREKRQQKKSKRKAREAAERENGL